MIPMIAIYFTMALSAPGPLSPQTEPLQQDLSGYKLAELELKGSIIFDSEKLKNVFRIKNGDPFDAKLIKEGLEQIQTLFYNFGYIDFTYTPHLDVNHKDKTVICSLLLVPGRIYFIDKINIYGSGSDENDREIGFALREAGINEKTVFSSIAFDKASRSLNTLLDAQKLILDKFEFTRSSKSPGILDITIKLQPAKR